MNSLKAGNIANFANINFYLPSTVKNGDTALQLTTTGSTDLGKSTVSAYLENASGLTVDSKINLIKTAGTLTKPNNTDTSNVKVDIAGLMDVEGNILLAQNNSALQSGFTGTEPTPVDPAPVDPTPAPISLSGVYTVVWTDNKTKPYYTIGSDSAKHTIEGTSFTPINSNNTVNINTTVILFSFSKLIK